MQINKLSFGNIIIDNISYDHDIVIDQGKIHKRDKSASRRLKQNHGHTPLTVEENIPWNCRRLIVGSGQSGSLPVLEEVYAQAAKHNVTVSIMTTPEAVKHVNEPDTNFVLHLTC